MSAPINVAENGLVNGWEGFTNFFTEDIPVFFTQTVPNAFEQGWNAVAQWVDEFVKPFFDSCHEWFSENAVWIWPAAIAFVAGAALVSAIAISIFYCCKPENGDDGSETASTASHRSHVSTASHRSDVSTASHRSDVSNASNRSDASHVSHVSHISGNANVLMQQNPAHKRRLDDQDDLLDMSTSFIAPHANQQINTRQAPAQVVEPPFPVIPPTAISADSELRAVSSRKLSRQGLRVTETHIKSSSSNDSLQDLGAARQASPAENASVVNGLFDGLDA